MATRPAGDRSADHGHAAKNKGFTLLELMVSVALLAVIITVISGAIRLGYRSVDSGEKNIGRLERFRMSLAIIDAQIQSAFPLTHEKQGVKVPYFKGGRDVLMFASNYSIWDGEKGFVHVTYRLGQNEKGRHVLYASEHTIGRENEKQTRLLEGFDDIYFGYFSRDPETGGPVETDLWTDDRTLPQWISVNLTKDGMKHSLIIPMRTCGAAVTQAPPGVM